MKQNNVKKIANDAMLLNYDVIVIFMICIQLGAIRMLVSRYIVCKTYIFIKNNMLSYKNWKQN